MLLQTHTPRAWANAALMDGAACIVDVETSGLDGSIIEIAVIDAATGEVLLDTLVDCTPVEIEPAAFEVHGLTARDLVGAPRWPEVFAKLAAITASRVVLAYNAKFDQGRVLHDCRWEGIDPVHLAEPARWQCVMARRCEALGLGLDGRLRLGGGHRALADVRATRAVLRMLADGRPDTDGSAVLAIRAREEARGVTVDS
ncbi:DNA polymerase-3 subunit epsilon [Rhodococcus rhodochrous J3]|uniref:DNA polymerase-3 subunit epsilon n=2 Tax=Rhodococcus rhodochrous TaxID=1829 RepID=A0ABY1MIL2_RHORH|nr:3'-5' exonuclease [Rhodococcus rhodochrous]MBF4476786.1 3'-5' exonuclease [Rhodococcus rhodochrous]SMG58757.1 DNA polymerase-3 subunit epsilon [Rhodococcus rhodochrous J3]